jgi:predicted RNase H-like HicB family nuclease
MIPFNLQIVFDHEEDGRWIAAVECLPGVLAYGVDREEARMKVEALAREVLQGAATLKDLSTSTTFQSGSK